MRINHRRRTKTWSNQRTNNYSDAGLNSIEHFDKLRYSKKDLMTKWVGILPLFPLQVNGLCQVNQEEKSEGTQEVPFARLLWISGEPRTQSN